MLPGHPDERPHGAETMTRDTRIAPWRLGEEQSFKVKPTWEIDQPAPVPTGQDAGA
jgi:hypothetical protein